MSNNNVPMTRMRRHKRRLVDDGTDLGHAVRDYIESVPLLARQLDIIGTGKSSGGAANAAPPMGGNGGSTKGSSNDGTDTTTDDSSDETTSASAASTRARVTPTTTSTSDAARTTSTATSSSSDLIDQILSSLTAASTTSTSTTSSSRLSSTSTPTSTSTSSSSSSSARATSTSASATSITPLTATMVVTSTPTRTQASVASPTQSTKSVSSAAGPIIGIVAGSLVGVVVLSGLIGFLFKKYNKKSDPYEGNPFDRDAFHRHSTMIPDNFDSDDGHNGGLDGMSPEMSEHHQQFNNIGTFNGPQYESGISAGVMAAAAGAAVAHNEGGPRPPTMFARHAQHQQQQQQVPQIGGYYKDGDYSHMANVAPSQDYGAPSAAFAGNAYAHGGYMEDPFAAAQHQGRSISPVPQLPPLAAFGGDPYSTAGVGRNQQGNNISNPYAHLDRVQPGQYIAKSRSSGSGSIRSVGSQEKRVEQHGASIATGEALSTGLAHQSSLNRSASNYTATPAPAYTPMEEREFNTQGRPSTSDRSGTPDLPNVQPGPTHHHQYSNQIFAPNHHNSNQLSVRNLVPDNRGLSAGQRPVSSASSFADPEDAYGGVY